MNSSRVLQLVAVSFKVFFGFTVSVWVHVCKFLWILETFISLGNNSSESLVRSFAELFRLFHIVWNKIIEGEDFFWMGEDNIKVSVCVY